MRRRPFPPYLPRIDAFLHRERVTIRLPRGRALHYDCNCNYMGGRSVTADAGAPRRSSEAGAATMAVPLFMHSCPGHTSCGF